MILLIPPNAQAFSYFDNLIDYWNREETKTPAQPAASKPEELSPEKPAFDWRKYQNPQNKEFFKEGDYTPPEAFMELAREPTDENIKNWFATVEAKNRIITTLHDRIATYVKKNGQKLQPEAREALSRQVKRFEVPKTDIKRFRFRLYFESSCPHCQKMIATMSDLQNQGYYVEVHQIDKKRPRYPVPFALIPASPAELKEKKIDSWPVLFVADTDKKLIYRINGYLSFEDVLKSLANK
jgi:hypothetical protein